MSVSELEVSRVGYNERLHEGEVIEEDGKQFVIIRILGYRLPYSRKMIFNARVIAQECDTLDLSADYQVKNPLICRYDTTKKEFRHVNISKIGDVFVSKGRAYEVTNINSIDYDVTYMVVSYQIKLISEWSQREMDEAILQKKLTRFKVIKRGKAYSLAQLKNRERNR